MLNLRSFARTFFTFKAQLFILALVSLVLLVLYKPALADRFDTFVASKQIPSDRIYYRAVFTNLPGVILLSTGIVLLLLAFLKQIRSAALWLVGRERSLLVLCCLVVVVIQIAEIFTVRTIYSDDSLEYLKLANTLFVHHAYISDFGFATSYWPVGYPAYLAFVTIVFGNTILVVRLLNVLITLGLVFTLYAVFKQWLDERERLLFILVTALFPNLVLSSNVLLSDYLFTLLLWLTVLLYLRRDYLRYSFVLIGLLIGAMSYLRPIALLLPVVFSIALWKEHGLWLNRLKLVAGFLIFIAVIAPWTLRNYLLFGTFVPISTNGGYNFLMGNRVGAPGGVNHDFSYNHANAHEAEESANAVRIGVRDILAHPLDAVTRMPRKIFDLYRRGDSSLSWAFKRTEKPLGPFLLSFLFYSTNAVSYFVIYISLLAIAGLYLFKRPVGIHPLLVVIYGYVILVTLVFVGSERYLIPVIPVHQFLFAKFAGAQIDFHEA